MKIVTILAISFSLLLVGCTTTKPVLHEYEAEKII